MSKILIATPSNGTVCTDTMYSIVRNVIHTKHEILISTSSSCNIVTNRTYLAEEAVEKDFDYLFFVDSDMYFNPESLDQLVEHDKDIIGAGYNRRNCLPLATTVKFLGDPPKDPKEPFKVKALGMGLVLIKVDVLRKVDTPWFKFLWNDDGTLKISEDVWFFKRAKEFGFDTWVDPKIGCRHIGTYQY